MSEAGRLVSVIRDTIKTLRQLADSLESALSQGQDEEREPGPLPTASSGARPADWNLLHESASSAAPGDTSSIFAGSRISTTSSYNEVAQLLTRAPQHCFDICSRLSGTTEFIRYRVQRAWEAGLWAKAVLEDRVPKPRPTPKIEVRNTVYIVVRGPGVQRPTRVHSTAAYYQLVPRFTEDSLSHGFPSLSEATVYCLALGIDLPEEQ